MKKAIIITAFALSSFGAFAQTNQKPDTSKHPHVYWSDLANISAANQELARRIHKLDIPALKRDGLDSLLNFIGSATPAIYQRTYADTSKRVKK